jgi:hypothetical protein
MNNWIRLHSAPRVCQKTPSKAKQKYYHQQSRKRWLCNQDGYKTEKILKKALLVGKLGTISGCSLYNPQIGEMEK